MTAPHPHASRSRSHRAFTPQQGPEAGMTARILALLSCLAGPAAAQDTINLSGTTITLRATDHPGAEAEIVMRNLPVNGPHHNGRYVLAWDGMVVEIRFAWNLGPGGADAIIATPPQHLVCEPADCVLAVPEGATGTLWLHWPAM